MRLLKLIESYILSEGRKEEVQKKYNQDFIDLDIHDPEDVISLFSHNDPSGNNKYLDWMTKAFIDLWQGTYPSEPGEEKEETIIDAITQFHKKQQKLTPEWVKEKGFPKRVVDNPKDINSYNIRDLKILSNILKRDDQKKQSRNDAIVLFENDKWLLLSPKSYEASCKYGAGTKWCIASKDSSSHYTSYTREGKLIFVIDKTEAQNVDAPMYKIAVYFKNGNITIWNAPDKQIGTDLTHFFSPKIIEVMTNYFRNSEVVDRTNTIKSKREQILNWFENENPRIANWIASADDDIIYISPVPVEVGYHLRVYPFFEDDEHMHIALIRGGIDAVPEEIKDWDRDLDSDKSTNDQINEIIQQTSYIIMDIEPIIQYDIIRQNFRESLANGWEFILTHHDESTIKFNSSNVKLSSYYWDKYDITLYIELLNHHAHLDCTFIKDNGKKQSMSYDTSLDLDLPHIQSSIVSLREWLTTKTNEFMEKTKKK